MCVGGGSGFLMEGRIGTAEALQVGAGRAMGGLKGVPAGWVWVDFFMA